MADVDPSGPWTVPVDHDFMGEGSTCLQCTRQPSLHLPVLHAEWERVDPEGVAALRRSAARFSNLAPEQLEADIGRWKREIQNERTQRRLTDDHPNIARRLARIRVAEELLRRATGSHSIEGES